MIRYSRLLFLLVLLIHKTTLERRLCRDNRRDAVVFEIDLSICWLPLFMPQLHSSWLQSAATFLKGDSAYLDEEVPPQLGSRHINELLQRHLFHPYDPKIAEDASHPCWAENDTFFKCMDGLRGVPLHEGETEEMPLHMKHVTCYHPHKVQLMKCLVKAKREARAAVSAQAVPSEAPAPPQP